MVVSACVFQGFLLLSFVQSIFFVALDFCLLVSLSRYSTAPNATNCYTHEIHFGLEYTSGSKAISGGPELFAGSLEMRKGPVGRFWLLAAGNVNCDCRECDSTDPHCVLCELQLFPGFNSVQCWS